MKIDKAKRQNPVKKSAGYVSASTACAAWLAVVSAACSGNATDASNATSGADAGVSLPEKPFEELVAYDWKIDPGEEAYYCVYKTLTEDLWVSDFRPLAPPGTHHVTVGYGDPGPPDGVVSAANTPTCTGVTLGTNVAFGATRGTDAFSMPPGVAVRVPAGKQLLLSVHVLNATPKPLNGHTGIEIVRADPAHIQHEAEIVFANDVNISVPPGKSTQIGTCTLDADVTIFAVLGHMHLAGRHMATTVVTGHGETKPLFDEDYSFDQQKFLPLDPPLQLHKGDELRTTCTYDNLGTDTLTFGESTTKNEMCIAMTYRYPAEAASFNCAK